MYGCMGLFINNKWSNAQPVLVPFKTHLNSPPPPPHPNNFDMYTWIKPPHSPQRLSWTRVTRETDNCIIHYMSGSARSNATTAVQNKIEYIHDILFLKIVAGEVVDVENDDIPNILIQLSQLF